MPSHEQMVAVVAAYIAAFAAEDVEAIVRLYASDATVEDPVASPVQRGSEAIRAFYTAAVATGAKLTLHGPVRTAGNNAAFSFSVRVTQHQIDVIDTFAFDEQGKITAMRAFWSPQNVRAL